MTTARTDWRAEPQSHGLWLVREYRNDVFNYNVADNLPEDVAKLIAAAPEKARLCDEMIFHFKQALDQWQMYAEMQEDRDLASESDAEARVYQQGRAVLKEASKL